MFRFWRALAAILLGLVVLPCQLARATLTQTTVQVLESELLATYQPFSLSPAVSSDMAKLQLTPGASLTVPGLLSGASVVHWQGNTVTCASDGMLVLESSGDGIVPRHRQGTCLFEVAPTAPALTLLLESGGGTIDQLSITSGGGVLLRTRSGNKELALLRGSRAIAGNSFQILSLDDESWYRLSMGQWQRQTVASRPPFETAVRKAIAPRAGYVRLARNGEWGVVVNVYLGTMRARTLADALSAQGFPFRLEPESPRITATDVRLVLYGITVRETAERFVQRIIKATGLPVVVVKATLQSEDAKAPVAFRSLPRLVLSPRQRVEQLKISTLALKRLAAPPKYAIRNDGSVRAGFLARASIQSSGASNSESRVARGAIRKEEKKLLTRKASQGKVKLMLARTVPSRNKSHVGKPDRLAQGKRLTISSPTGKPFPKNTTLAWNDKVSR